MPPFFLLPLLLGVGVLQLLISFVVLLASDKPQQRRYMMIYVGALVLYAWAVGLQMSVDPTFDLPLSQAILWGGALSLALFHTAALFFYPRMP